MFRAETAVLVIGLILIGGLVYGFSHLTDGVNKPVTIASVERSTLDETVAPPADAIGDDGAPVELGGPSILTDAAKSELMVNFNQCEPGSGSLDLESGAVVFTLIGRQGNDCQAAYQILDESASCTVPASVGQLRFNVTPDGISFGVIDRYCE